MVAVCAVTPPFARFFCCVLLTCAVTYRARTQMSFVELWRQPKTNDAFTNDDILVRVLCFCHAFERVFGPGP